MEKIIQIDSVTDGSRIITTVLTNEGRLFKVGGQYDYWTEMSLPPLYTNSDCGEENHRCTGKCN